MQRYDSAKFSKATKTNEGFLIDSPIVARTGIQIYQDGKGGQVKELRLPSEVFKESHLDSMLAKPITVLHRGKITAKNAKQNAVGTILSRGRQDSELPNCVRLDVVIHHQDAISKAESGEYAELSMGYETDVENTSGWWKVGTDEYIAYTGNGTVYADGSTLTHKQDSAGWEWFDKIQRNMASNHMSMVPLARAGSIARFNLDGDQYLDFTTHEEKTMIKIRLDSGLEYDTAPEVAQALTAEKSRADGLQSERDTVKAEKDALQAKFDAADAKIKTFDEQLKKAREDGAKDAKARAELEAEATKLGIKCDGLTDAEIKGAFIKKVRGDSVDLNGKSEAYIEAMLDIARADAAKGAENMADQRRKVNQDSATSTTTTNERTDTDDAYAQHMKSFNKKEGDK